MFGSEFQMYFFKHTAIAFFGLIVFSFILKTVLPLAFAIIVSLIKSLILFIIIEGPGILFGLIFITIPQAIKNIFQTPKTESTYVQLKNNEADMFAGKSTDNSTSLAYKSIALLYADMELVQLVDSLKFDKYVENDIKAVNSLIYKKYAKKFEGLNISDNFDLHVSKVDQDSIANESIPDKKIRVFGSLSNPTFYVNI
ncbi:hypothetical protein A9Q84_00225 [Halobacteriovorax marinus]|uniref:Uncharacterized protein n=1 Tax=Halobacteriovorax marinus TaxID=97084 RepID=A0A1Y5FIW6_9BACT|nr:hypothetical protein A9Q84_00225 [Halobacteriovorax marinus]